jgi:hypothetical protein
MELIKSYIDGEITSSQFETAYLKLFKEEKRIPPADIYEILNKLFTDVDAFCADPKLRNAFSLDERQLLECARSAYVQLQER